MILRPLRSHRVGSGPTWPRSLTFAAQRANDPIVRVRQAPACQHGRMVFVALRRPAVLLRIGVLLTIAFLAVDIADVAANSETLRQQVGVDYRLYIDTATRWLSGGPYFQAYQLAGPYPVSAGDILYPPVALILFVPFTVLPALLWWLLPLAAVGFSVARLRPDRAAWPWVAACLAWPTTPLKILTGNPVIWAVAALALGVVYAWPSVIVLIKPSLFPFALFGSRSRRWWLALGAFAIVSLPFGTLWIDWIHSLLNSQGAGLAYSSLEIPMLAMPLIAWVGRTRGTDSSPAPGGATRGWPDGVSG